MTMDFLEAAFDWADYRDVPVAAFRDRLGSWHVRLTFRDASGWFHGSCRVRPRERGMDEGYAEMVFSMLDTASAQIREDRIRAFNALPMRVGAGRVGRLNVVSREPGDVRRSVEHLFNPRLGPGRNEVAPLRCARS
jgi:hypothetical protein